MGFLAYLMAKDNRAPDALFTVTSENASYPVANMLAVPISKPFRSVEGQIAEQTIDMDFSIPVALDAVVLVNHNLTQFAALNLYGGNAAPPDGSMFNEVIAWRERTAWSLFSGTETWRHWRLRIHDPSNSWGFIQVGYLLLGLKTQLGFGFLEGWRVSTLTRNRVTEGELGPPFVGLELTQRFQVGIEFDDLTATQRDTLTAFLDGAKRELKPMLVVPDPSRSEAYFGRIIEDHAVTQVTTGFAGVSPFIFESDAVGRILPEPLPTYEDGDTV